MGERCSSGRRPGRQPETSRVLIIRTWVDDEARLRARITTPDGEFDTYAGGGEEVLAVVECWLREATPEH